MWPDAREPILAVWCIHEPILAVWCKHEAILAARAAASFFPKASSQVVWDQSADAVLEFGIC